MSLAKTAASKQGAEAPGAGRLSSRASGASPLLELQQALGNQQMGRLLRDHRLQAKLAVNQPGDVYEQEADRVAQKVVSSSAPPGVQRKCACGGAAGAGGECEKCGKENEGLVQRKTEHGAGPATAPPVVHEALGSAGRPLDASTRAFFEPRFGQSFEDVRVHTDGRAAEAAGAVDALAFTVGRDVVFGPGQYAPSSPEGQRLLAHELTHVVQQSGARHPANISVLSGKALQRQPKAQAADEDVERSKIIDVSKRTTDALNRRAWELVWRMLTRYFPEYSPKISAVGYDEKEPSVRVEIHEAEVSGKKMQTATVTVGKAFIEATSEESLRARIAELGERLHQSGLLAIPDPQVRGTEVWKIIHDKFPKKGARLAGTSYDANLPGLRTEFDSGEVQVGKTKITWSGPRLYYGKAFLALTDAEKEAKLKAELKKVDQWCVENGRLRKADLEDEEITTRIRGLSSAKLTALRDKVADADVKNFVSSLLTMSTPLTQGLTRQAGGAASVVLGNVTVMVRPDITDVAGLSGGDTDFNFPPTPGIQWRPDRRGIVNSFTPPGGLTITIQTRYGHDSSPDTPSGYGRGTTESDKAVEGKSLRVHEGSHGVEFINMIAAVNQAHPYPSFTGAVGDTREVFQRKVNEFNRARDAFIQALRAARGQAVRNVDCVGVTIDEFNQAHHRRRARICR